jgi:hypothetical protein
MATVTSLASHQTAKSYGKDSVVSLSPPQFAVLDGLPLALATTPAVALSLSRWSYATRCRYQNGPVAQRLEQGTHNPLVPGSNPGGPTPKAFRGFDGPPLGKRIRAVRNESFSTMKAFFSIMLALAISIGTTEAGPVRTAKNAAKSSVQTAKNVGHSVVKGTRRAVRTVVYTFTP